MASSLIRGKYVIGKAENRTDVAVIEDGAVFQRDGTVVEIGRQQDLAAKYQPDAILGSTGHVVMPGFVNSHHHVGVTPFQLGSPDHPLELWFASRMATRNVDLPGRKAAESLRNLMAPPLWVRRMADERGPVRGS